jgi:hypothetical protein
MAYTAEKPTRALSSAELRQRIPGWGADLDKKDRPAVPKERFAPEVTGAHWDFPERQEELVPRERSIEHKFLTPVFGTSAPLKGLSGVIRRYAYAQYSEGRLAHWMLLILGDRVDAIESHVASLASGHPDNPITETGILSERKYHGFASRFGKRRADVKHSWIDPIVVAGPWLLVGWAAFVVARAGVRAVRR